MIQSTNRAVATALAPPTHHETGVSLTVALCTHNHRNRLQRTLQALTRIEPPYGRWELLLVDNACTDGTTELLAATNWRAPDIEVRVVREQKLGLSNARNRAIQDATGEYIVFMDDDETPDPYWLRAFEKIILAQQPDALGGRIEVMFEDGERPPWLNDELSGFIGKLDHGGMARQLADPATPIFGGNFAFRRNTFTRIGNFDAALGRKGTGNVGGEDTDMYRRLIGTGCNVWWVPDAVIYHRIQATKLRRRYFLNLHFQQGRVEGSRRRGDGSRLPPAYLLPQLWRAVKAALSQRLRQGRDTSLRKEMNVAFFVGVVVGWTYGRDAPGLQQPRNSRPCHRL